MIISKPTLNEQQLNIAKDISRELHLEMSIAKLLVNRGIDSVESAKIFISPGKSNFYSPYLIKGIQEAKDKILLSIAQNKKILIFGDYDADGICATSIMYYAFKELGVNVDTFIPERELGYGITEKSLEIILKKQVDLIITVDCGVSCVSEIDKLLSLGIDVIVTDHHELPEILPNTIVVNIKIPSDYPFNNLCGAGVAYKLAYALIGEKANSLLDFVALATIADAMELNGENRDLVAEGIKLFNNPREQFKALIELCNVKEINSGALAYSIAPKVNACGRMGNARLGLELFISQDIKKIYEIAQKLIDYNTERVLQCDLLYNSAKQKMQNKDLNTAVITLYDESWHGGLVGITSAKIAEEYNRPTILFAKTDGCIKGSARSIDGVNFYEAIEACSKHLVGFGGHSQAAGVSILEENLEAFTKDLNNYICTHFADKFIKQTVVEEFVSQPITINQGRQLNLLEPFGTGNKKPLYAVKADTLKIKKLSGEHISFKTEFIDLLYFNALNYAEELGDSHTKAIVFDLNYSVFRGQESVKGFVKNYEVIVENNPKNNLILFEQYLNSLLTLQECKQVDKEQINELISNSLKVPYGTCYTIADLNNLQYYPTLQNLPIEYGESKNNNLLNKIVIAGNIESGYSQIICLDNFAVNGGVACKDIKPFKELNFNRETVANVFSVFNNVYKSLKDLIAKNTKYNPYELVFAYCVLKELGIVRHKDYITRDFNVKNQITNSKIFNKFQAR